MNWIFGFSGFGLQFFWTNWTYGFFRIWMFGFFLWILESVFRILTFPFWYWLFTSSVQMQPLLGPCTRAYLPFINSAVFTRVLVNILQAKWKSTMVNSIFVVNQCSITVAAGARHKAWWTKPVGKEKTKRANAHWHLPYSTTMRLIQRRGKEITAKAAQDGGWSAFKGC